eukprot:3308295-Prymnesium_polylepis.1
MPMMMPNAALGTMPVPMGLPGMGVPGMGPGYPIGVGGFGQPGIGSGMGGLLASAAAGGQQLGGMLPGQGLPMPGVGMPMGMGLPGGTGATGPMQLPTGPKLPPGVPPPPGVLGQGSAANMAGEEGDFSSFMLAFRDEIKASREHDKRVSKFVPSSACAVAAPSTQQQIQQRADEIFGESPMAPGRMADDDDDEDDFAEWPDELLLLGVNMDEAEAGSTTSTTTTTTTTTTDETDETDDEEDDEDAWPLEMLMM